ncbi:MAG TPA: hypothetical protein VK894_11330, partial [Jiangellales bacterium]|nr:hypothetical protein [Jiangellales bacterium]
VDNLEREHVALVERLGGIRDVLSRLPGLGGVAAVADETPDDEVPPDVTPADETPADEVVAVDPDATQLFATPVDAEGPIDARDPVAADALGVEPEAADHQTASADEAEPIGEAPAAADQGVDDARQPADLEATVVGTVPAVEETTVQAAVADRGRGRPKGRR